MTNKSLDRLQKLCDDIQKELGRLYVYQGDGNAELGALLAIDNATQLIRVIVSESRQELECE